MALVKCRECGKEISDKSDVCVHCGMEQENPISTKKQSNWFGWFIKTNIISFILMVFGAIVIISGQTVSWYSEPERTIISPKKYVGGDAYNYIMEASIKGGEISGARAANASFETTEAIYFCTGFIIISLGLFRMKFERG